MNQVITINRRQVGLGQPVYMVAEMSANHSGSYERAAEIVHAARESGADAIKVQTYTADTLTIPSKLPHFRIQGTLWDGRTLHDLYQEAHMPWEWQPRLKTLAESLGMDFFSTPFDKSAVDFLESMHVPAHKIASFELVDLPLIREVARTGKPVIMSTGMASVDEIRDAVDALRGEGNEQVVLLKCTSAYPARPEEMNLRTIPDMVETFRAPVGLSDHSMGFAVAVAAVALGACVIEKHFTLRRADGGPDSAFSMEPAEFKAMVEAVRMTEKALGRVSYEPDEVEARNKVFRRSLFVVRDVRKGERLTPDNVRSIRPGHGMPPKYIDEVMGATAAVDIPAGTPLSRELFRPPS